MLHSEFEELAGKKVEYSMFRAVEILYMYHPDFEKKSKQEVAQEYLENKINFYSLLQDETCKKYAEDIVYSSEDNFSYYDVNVMGYIRNETPKSIQKVFDGYILPELKKKGIDLSEYDYFHPSCRGTKDSWPLGVRVACFSVTGGSEGHYIHVEALTEDGHKCLILGKTFNGFDHALKLSNILSTLLS